MSDFLLQNNANDVFRPLRVYEGWDTRPGSLEVAAITGHHPRHTEWTVDKEEAELAFVSDHIQGSQTKFRVLAYAMPKGVFEVC